MITSMLRMLALISLACLFASQAGSESVPSGYDPAQLYNLANAYARAGQPGLAVLTYERARLLAPNDEDIEVNLRRVRESAHVSAERPSRWQVIRMDPLTVETACIAGLIFTGLSLVALRRGFRMRRVLAACMAAGIGLLALAVGNAVLVWPKLHSAVVIAAQAPVRAAPAPLGDGLFNLPEAEIVNITAEHDDFVLVTTQQGTTGWMSRAAVTLIVPRR